MIKPGGSNTKHKNYKEYGDLTYGLGIFGVIVIVVVWSFITYPYAFISFISKIVSLFR